MAGDFKYCCCSADDFQTKGRGTQEHTDWPQQTVVTSEHYRLWWPLSTADCGDLWPQQTVVTTGHNKLVISGHNKLWWPLNITDCGDLWPQQTVVTSGHNKLWWPLNTTDCGDHWPQQTVLSPVNKPYTALQVSFAVPIEPARYSF